MEAGGFHFCEDDQGILSDGMTSESMMQRQPGERAGAVAAAAGWSWITQVL